jgi:hypothetical protein
VSNLDEELAKGLQEHRENMSRLPDAAIAILREGPNFAKFDEKSGNWTIADINNGKVIAVMKAVNWLPASERICCTKP